MIKKRIFMSVAGMIAFAISFAQGTNVWEAPAVPAEDISTLKSVTTGYLLNVEADAFVVNGMTSNVQACATRLTNGDTQESTPHRCTAMVGSDGTVRFRLTSSSSSYISCVNANANNVVVNRTTNPKFTYTETAEGSHVYTLTSATLEAPLDVAWTYGGPLTLKDGQGKTTWAFIKETSVTNGNYARYKAKRQLYNIYKALADAGMTGQYKDALESAYKEYTASDATLERLQTAARKLFHATYADITTPINVSFLLVNADMVGNGSTDGWDKSSPAFSWAEFERYHSVCTLEQGATFPIGTYDFGFHSLYRQDGSDAAPTFVVTASNEVKTTVPLMSDIDFGVTNASENNWKQGPKYYQPDGMKSCGQALAHGDAVAWAKNVVVDGTGSVYVKAAMASGSQWLNWQGVTVIYKGVGQDALRSVLANTISQAQMLYGDGTGNGASILKSAIDQAQAVYDNPQATNADISGWCEKLSEIIDSYRKANASEVNPIDYTSLITNPSFEDGTDDWTISGMGTQGNTAFSIKAGSTYLERWTGKGNKVGDGYVMQTIKDLPVGKYQLKVAAQNIQEDTPSRSQNGAWIVANIDSQKVTIRKQYTLTFTNIEKDAIIGFIAEGATGNWISCDNFRLYYIGGNDTDFRDALGRYIQNATSLQNMKMHDSAKEQLDLCAEAAVKVLTAPEGTGDYTEVSTPLRLATEEAKRSIQAYEALNTAIADADATYGDGSNPGATDYLAAIDAAKTVYENGASTYDELAEQVVKLEDAKLLFLIQSPTGNIPTITTDKRYARGATMAFGRFTYKVNGAKMKQAGFCYSTEHNPTIFDEKSTRTLSNNGLIYVMENMKPATVYYARPYVLTEGYQVAYGDELKIITIPKGTMTYWYNNGGSAEENDRINYALKNGTTIWNNLMNIQGVNLSVSYGSGTPTADCSYGGSMRVGPNSAYQRTGTIMHEAAHGVGVGTIGGWWALLVDGVWTGVRANEVLQFWDNDNSAKMKGDSMHMWPYGINGAQEDSGTDLLYYGNALIIEGMHEDGVQPTGNCFATPAYTYDYVDDQWYYIQNEDETFGFQKAYLQATASGLKWTEVATESLGSDESFAWTITFDPKTQYYSFRNVGTGALISYNGSKFTTVKRETPTANEKLQLMPSRSLVTWKNDGKSYKLRGYWMLRANGGSATAMTGAANGNVSGTNFDNNQADTKQRWLILSEENGIASGIEEISVKSEERNVKEAIYNLAGQKLSAPRKGLNIIDGKKIYVK
ncbi:MAG: hypothetical protein J5770_03180 [Bacteroidaceae bacterium]|nr:hypothetical protein [Bacteroidaceae bacterium]